MAYGRVLDVENCADANGAVVSHLAELVRGDFAFHVLRPPHPAVLPKASLRPDGHLLPREEGPLRLRENILPPQAIVTADRIEGSP